ncbi:MAG: response regulator transcription factor [Aggregatilineales bacterium]|nr:response regulator transcription factor [Chloroflexota bacterium]HOA25633.1 response regulator transcription factor [Aggregatilineales bacterium]HPV06407.1 response regulator transcription factor [Aggregatilineales bacterium]HQE18374.1 response regulator transcription factor [Aggregatilineales bacterium]
MKKIRVVLADDHAVLRAGLRALLNAEPDLEVIGEAANGHEAIDQVARLAPDVIIMDLTMPDMNGLDAIAEITSQHLDTKVLVLTMHADEQYIVQVIQSGAAGYVLKSAADTDLIHAIRQVAQGKTYLYPDAAHILVEYYRRQDVNRHKEEDSLSLLSEREREVLTYTARGFSSREIGEMLFISDKTVETYRRRLMEKLDLHHRSDIVQYALQKGLLEADD